MCFFILKKRLCAQLIQSGKKNCRGQPSLSSQYTNQKISPKWLFHNIMHLKADTLRAILRITNRFARKNTFLEAICNKTFAAKSSSKDNLNKGR